MNYPILRHKNCRNADCLICLEDHEELEKYLKEITGTGNKYDLLGKYHFWLSKNGINPETEWGWATEASFESKNIDSFVSNVKESEEE